MKNVLKVFLLLLDDIVLVAVVLWVLPRFGIHLHWGLFAGLIVALGAVTYIVYRSITTVSRRKAVGGVESLIGATGKAITPLTPEGSVRIDGETWRASSVDSNINIGEEVVVTGCQGLTLVVKPSNPDKES